LARRKSSLHQGLGRAHEHAVLGALDVDRQADLQEVDGRNALGAAEGVERR
jgi:hypothetical protein